jgi:hypothetical protein
MFMSEEFHVEQCDYLQQLMGPGCSDHSALSASLTFDGQSSRGRPQQPLSNRCSQPLAVPMTSFQ